MKSILKNITKFIKSISKRRRYLAIFWIIFVVAITLLSPSPNRINLTILNFQGQENFIDKNDYRAIYHRVLSRLLIEYEADIESDLVFFQIRENSFIAFITYDDLSYISDVKSTLTSIFKEETHSFYDISLNNLQTSISAINAMNQELNLIKEEYSFTSINLELNSNTVEKQLNTNQTLIKYQSKVAELLTEMELIKTWEPSIFNEKKESSILAMLIYMSSAIIVGLFLIIFFDIKIFKEDN
jgi:hypothetical protein